MRLLAAFLCVFFFGIGAARAQDVKPVQSCNPDVQACVNVLVPGGQTAALLRTEDDVRRIAKEEIAKKISDWDSKAIDETIYPQLQEKLFQDLIKKLEDDALLKAKVKQLDEVKTAERIKTDPEFRKELTRLIAQAEQKPEAAVPGQKK